MSGCTCWRRPYERHAEGCAFVPRSEAVQATSQENQKVMSEVKAPTPDRIVAIASDWTRATTAEARWLALEHLRIVDGPDFHTPWKAAIDSLQTLEVAAFEFLKKWGPHSGSCCVFDEAKNVLVTRESCRCEPLTVALRDALGSWAWEYPVPRRERAKPLDSQEKYE